MGEGLVDESLVWGLKKAMRSLVRPVAVVTAEHGGAHYAMAATAFCEVSMEPPSMLVCINRGSATYNAIESGEDIGLNLLADDQEEVSRLCGQRASPDEKFQVGDWQIEKSKPPLLADCCASMVLRPVQMVDQGSHAVIIGEVIDVQCQEDLGCLTFHDGAYHFPLAQAAFQLLAHESKARETENMTYGYMMMELMRAFYWFDEGLQASLKKRGWQAISRSQSFALANIALDVHRPADLARNLGVSRQAVSKMLQEMADQDLVVITPDPEDRRAQLVHFSEKSERLRADALDILDRLEKRLGSTIGEASMNAIRAALEKDWGEVPEISVQ